MNNKKTIHFLLCFVLVLRTPLEYLGNNFKISGITFDSLVLLITLGIMIMVILKMGILRFLDKTNFLLFIFIFVLIVSLLLSIDKKMSLTSVFSNIFNIFCFVFVYKYFDNKQVRLLLLCSIIGLSIPLFDSYLSYFFEHTTIIKHGYVTIRSAGLVFGLTAWASSTMAFYLIMYLVFYESYNKGNLFKPFDFNFSKKIILFIIITFLGIIIIGFRSSIILAVLFLGLLTIFSGKITSKIKTLIFASILISSILFLYRKYYPGGYDLLIEAMSPDYFNDTDPVRSTFASRSYFMQKYLFNFNIPLFGYGARTFGINNSISDSGSLYVELWFSFGPVGFLILILFFVKLIIENIKIGKNVFIYRYIIIVIICILIGGVTEATLLGIRGLYFYILLGAMYNFRMHDLKMNKRNNNVFINNHMY